MRRIAIVSSQAFSLLNFRGPVIKALVAAGAEVYALAPDYDDDLRTRIAALGALPVDCSLSRTGMSPVQDGIDTLRLAKLLRRIAPDTVLGYFIKPVIYGTLAASLARVPRRFALIEGLGYVFGPADNDQGLKRRLLRHAVERLYAAALGRAERVFFLNDDDISEFVRNGIVGEAKVVKLGGIGVDLSEWLLSPPIEQPVTFLLAARLLREKGVVEYAEAAKRVKSRYPNTRFILLGGLDPNPSGLARSEVEAWVEAGLLEWHGHVDVKPWLAQASVYVLPSYYREGVPRSTQEAMAMGRPIITTDWVGCRETVEHGRNGFLVPVRDTEALADAMIRFVEQPQLIRQMGTESRRMAEERFDVCEVNRKLLQGMGF